MEKKTKGQLLGMYKWVGGCSEGLIAVRDEGGKEFHVYPDGTPVYEQRFDWVGFFHKGKAEVRLGGKHLFIRTDGTKADT